MDKRIQKKYDKEIEDFIFEITVLFFVINGQEYRQCPSYAPTTIKQLLEHAEGLGKILASNSKQYVNVYQYMKNDQMFQTSSLGWALCETILSYFKSEQDLDKSLEEKESKGVLKEAYLSNLGGRMCIGGEPNQIPMQMGLIPTKTYKRVKKTQKSIVSGQNVPEGEVVEEKVVSEIINEDGTKKVIIKKTVHHKK